MKVKAFNFSIFILVISSLLFLLPISFTFASETTDTIVDTKVAYFLLGDGNTPYKSNKEAGNVSGYGKYQVGQKDVTLTATANDGFELVGWNIQWVEIAEDKTTSTQNIFINLTTEGVLINEASIDFTLIENGDEKKLTISEVPQNLIIDAVFDYTYYNVTAPISMLEVTDLNLEKIAINGTECTIYYSTKTESTETEYTTAFISNGSGGYNYFPKLYKTDNALYTKHNTTPAEGEGVAQNIDISRGAFRYGDELSFNLNVAIDSTDLYNSKNIDVTKFTFNLGEDYYETIIKTDGYSRTEAFGAEFKVLNTDVAITFEYDKLYIATLNYFVDDVSADSTDLSMLENAVAIHDIYSTISDKKQYFIKQNFRIVCDEKISATINGYTYDYYKFAGVAGGTEKDWTTNNIKDNFTVDIKYTSVKYNITFQFALLANGQLTTNASFSANLEKTIETTRGQTHTISKTDDSNNTGYSFYGFVDTLTVSTEKNTSIDITIDETKPTNVVVYMIFEEVNYTIKLANYNQISIGTGDNISYPIKELSLTQNTGNADTSSTITKSATDLTTNSILTSTVTLNDVLTLSATANAGFEILGFKVDTTFETYQSEYTITAEFLDSFADKDNVITINVYEEYVYHTLTYYIDAKKDVLLSPTELYIMADIFIDEIVRDGSTIAITEQQLKDNNIGLETTETSTKFEIKLTGLRLNDVVTLASTGKSATNATTLETYTYAFAYFTKSGKTSLEFTKTNNTYYCQETIEEDVTIQVIYSLPTTKLEILIDNTIDTTSVYDITKLAVYQQQVDNSTKKLSYNTEIFNDECRVVYEVAVGEVEIKLNPNGETASDLFKFGYYLTGYTFNNGSGNASVTSEELTYKLTIVEGETHILKIDYGEIQFKFDMAQHGAGYNGELVSDTLTLSTNVLEFNLPAGHYVGKVEYNNSELKGWASENQTDTTYNHTLTEDNFKMFAANSTLSDGIYTINLKITFEAVKYTITIQLKTTDGKTNGYSDLTSVVDISSTEIEDLEITKEVNKYIFSNIPYGSSIDLTADVLKAEGMTSNGWEDDTGVGLTNSSTYSIANIGSNYNLIYSMAYLTYNVNLVYEQLSDSNTMAEPKLLINDAESKIVTLLDKIVVEPNATKENGFKFLNIYQGYVYSEETWAGIWNQLYIKQGNNYLANVSDIYDETAIYCLPLSTKVENNNIQYSDNQFRLTNYYISGNTITIYLQYELIKVKLNNINQYIDDTVLNIDGFDIANCAEFTVYKNNKVADIANETFNINDSVEIFMVMNNVDIVMNDKTEISEQVKIAQNLFDALELKSIDMLNETYMTFEVSGKGYIFSFNMTEIIGKIEDNAEEVTIAYKYAVKTKKLTLTTSITNDEIYERNNSLDVRVRTAFLYNSSNTLSNERVMSISHNFGEVAECNYSITGTNAGYFKINSYVVKDASGNKIDKSNYLNYGIKLVDGKFGIPISYIYLTDITIEFQVEPVINYNKATKDPEGNYVFEKVFQHDELGNGIAQTLSVGEEVTNDISSANIILASFRNNIQYYPVYNGEVGSSSVNPTNVGTYKVEWLFNTSGDNQWLKGITITYKVYMKIIPKPIEMTFNETDFTKLNKSYDGTSSIDFNLLKPYLYVNLGDGVNIQVTGTNSNFYLSGNPTAIITTTSQGEETSIAQANENIYYNISISNIVFNNSNFILNGDSIVIKNAIQIKRAELTLSGLKFYNKVYDGTTRLVVQDGVSLELQGVKYVNGIKDNVSVDAGKLKLAFASADVGANKELVLDAASALIGSASNNYKVVNILFDKRPSIYPYSLKTEVEGFGVLEIINEVGRNNPKDESLVSLIPIGAKFNVEVIKANSPEYSNIYYPISQYLRGNRIFAVAYTIGFEVENHTQPVSNKLLLKMPNVEGLMGVISLNGENTSEVKKYSEDAGTLIIELSQIESVDTIVLVKQRVLFKLWQIVLIVLLILLILLIIIIIIVIIRRKKLKKYSINEKI